METTQTKTNGNTEFTPVEEIIDARPQIESGPAHPNKPISLENWINQKYPGLKKVINEALEVSRAENAYNTTGCCAICGNEMTEEDIQLTRATDFITVCKNHRPYSNVLDLAVVKEDIAKKIDPLIKEKANIAGFIKELSFAAGIQVAAQGTQGTQTKQNTVQNPNQSVIIKPAINIPTDDQVPVTYYDQKTREAYYFITSHNVYVKKSDFESLSMVQQTIALYKYDDPIGFWKMDYFQARKQLKYGIALTHRQNFSSSMNGICYIEVKDPTEKLTAEPPKTGQPETKKEAEPVDINKLKASDVSAILAQGKKYFSELTKTLEQYEEKLNEQADKK